MPDPSSLDSASELPDYIENALADALLRSPAAREQRLRVLVEEHPGLRVALGVRIAELLGSDAGPADGRPPEGSVVGDRGGERVGRYKLLERIADGGMGTVWMAEQREPIRRRVAIKVIKLGMDTKQVMARFEAERQALAMMDHPHIAKVLDAGSTASGRPYFVMEYIRGIPILEYCDREKIDTRHRLELFIKVCHALQHAHQKGIIHRDIKPSNVLVTMHDGVPVPKVIDFGIAKATSGELTDKTLFTAHRQMIGTPAYMSPEQAEMSGLDIDTRSDIYSLGVLLYELLTGSTPFDNEALLTKGFVEMVRTIREVEPHKPSTRISTLGGTAHNVASKRRTDSKRLGVLLRGDLDWIAMKCLEKDRSRRYETANGLATDIQRHLDDEPVLAGPPRASYRFRKFVRRNRGQVAAMGIVSGALLLGLAVSSFGWQRALEEKGRADAARLRETTARTHAELLAGFLGDTLDGIGPSIAKGRDITMLKEMMDGAAARIASGELDSAPEAELRLRRTIGNIYRELALYEQADKMLAPALDLARSIWADDHPETARAMGDLATLHYVQGNLSEAEQLYRAALAMAHRLFPGDDQRVASAQGQLAVLLQARGELREAERLYREALAMNRRLFAGDHKNIAWNMQALATLLSARGDESSAEPLYLDSLAMNRRLFPGDDPRVATGLGHLAILLHGRGDLERAESYYRESLAMNRRLFAGDHPNVATGLNALAMLLRDRGKTAEATRLFIDSMEMSKRLFPDAQPNGAADLDALASLYWSEGDLDRSIPLFEEALAAREAKLGREHLDTLTTVAKLGVGYREAGRPKEALALLEEAACASLEHPSLAIARPALLEVYATAGHLVPAADADRVTRLLQELRAVETAAGPERGLDRAEGLSRYAAALLGLGQWDAAEPLLRESLTIRERQAPDDWRTFRCASRHGRALLGQRRIEAAKEVLLPGYQGLSDRAGGIPPAHKACLPEAIEYIVTLYEVVGDGGKATAWRQKLSAARENNRPAAGGNDR